MSKKNNNGAKQENMPEKKPAPKKNNRGIIISVSDKTGVLPLAHSLYEMGYTLLLSGNREKKGTFKTLYEYFEKECLDTSFLMSIESYTGMPEILGGRVKTLHPLIYGGILAQYDKREDVSEVHKHGIMPIDMVVVNLYPFKETILKKNTLLADAIEQIDIGGVSLLRAASKNFKHIIVLVNPSDYDTAVCLLKKQNEKTTDKKTGKTTGEEQALYLQYRAYFANISFSHTAYYETTISEYMRLQASASLPPLFENEMGNKEKSKIGNTVKSKADNEMGNTPSLRESPYMTLGFERKEILRYGENPHQKASVYEQAWPYANKSSIINAKQIHGKQLSFNNIKDAEAAISIVNTFAGASSGATSSSGAVAVGIKHGNPCGAAIRNTIQEAWNACYKSDTTSIFGGIVALSHEVDMNTAIALSKIFLEIIIAPKFSKEARDILRKKKNIRLLELPFKKDTAYEKQFPHYIPKQYSSINGGLLVGDMDRGTILEKNLRCVTKRKPSQTQIQELLFAWNICKFVKSNAIVITKQQSIAGVGAGQMNRVGSAYIALEQAQNNKKVKGAVLASDAFFPMNDTVAIAAQYGIASIIQPGGSIRDQESIDMCNEHNISMVLTGMRHFLH